ncbi:uncharacterized protein CC84DRAFT_1167682 [Paraphaeosphaeria sporulosa]|uniref:Uncharacterized protein n=1 Tax=Paraphaeosphaeria sporulosa TaxID=1460663 RepID=A0A177C1Z6_9PLEO|nr:uncharacterized protein CC84DRAFT_1167682 [Paraphaeosphaeria sporulosa]OAG01476.1 hypothetical protein CC84DRAFT_1167682 [Paraphaeosphaeria sporulosa]
MAAPTPELILYDLASTQGVCFSPAVWRIRLLLNYKSIPYTTTFLEFPDIAPTLSALNIPPHDATTSKHPYTVPAIHHLPTNTFVMDSLAIAAFIEKTYPVPEVVLTSDLGAQIEEKARKVVGPAFYVSLVPREIRILSPRSQEYFRRTREAALGHPLEDLLAREDAAWEAIGDEARAAGALMRTHKESGPFVLGEKPCFTDFFIAGALQNARVVDVGVWERCMRVEGFREVYEACEEWMGKKD